MGLTGQLKEKINYNLLYKRKSVKLIVKFLYYIQLRKEIIYIYIVNFYNILHMVNNSQFC